MAMNNDRPIKTWVLLRGLSREQAHWGDFAQCLQQYCPELTCICLDLPGTGSYFQQTSPESIRSIREQLQQQLQQQLKALQLTGPVGIIGLSLGGMIALDWFEADPETMQAVVVINTSANNFSLLQRIKPMAILRCALIMLGINLRFCEKTILRMVSRLKHNDSALLEDWVAIQRARPVSRQTVYRQLRAAADFSMPKVLPTGAGLVLSSRQDGMVSPLCSEGIAKQYGWTLREHSEAGHDLPLDDPEWVADEIGRWLERPSASDSLN